MDCHKSPTPSIWLAIYLRASPHPHFSPHIEHSDPPPSVPEREREALIPQTISSDYFKIIDIMSIKEAIILLIMTAFCSGLVQTMDSAQDTVSNCFCALFTTIWALWLGFSLQSCRWDQRVVFQLCLRSTQHLQLYNNTVNYWDHSHR